MFNIGFSVCIEPYFQGTQKRTLSGAACAACYLSYTKGKRTKHRSYLSGLFAIASFMNLAASTKSMLGIISSYMMSQALPGLAGVYIGAA
jgi:hypothetical protein